MIAKTLGFDVTIKRRRRQTNMNFETVERNVPRRTSLKTLKERKDEMIRDGEITVGEKIVPIEHEILRIDPEGNIVILSSKC